MFMRMRPYVVLLLSLNMLAVVMNPLAAALMQLGPLMGPVFLKDSGLAWVGITMFAAVSLLCSWLLRKHFYASFTLFSLAIIVWYASGNLFMMFLE